LQFLKLYLFCLPMLFALRFHDLSLYKIIFHRKWFRFKCVSYLLFDALFCFKFLYSAFALSSFMALTWASLQTTAPSSKALKKKHSWKITHCFLFSSFSFIWILEVITTVITAPYPLYFVVVPRETSNLIEVRFGDVAVLKQISVLHRKNSWKLSEYLFDLRFLVHMPHVMFKLSLVLHFLIWATENPLKIRSLSAVLFWQISANICVCRFITFFLSSFDHGTFGEVATVIYALYVVVLSWNLKQKGLIQCYAYTNVANRIVFSFVWRKFSSVGIGEWWDDLKNGQKLKIGDAHVTPRNIQ
jgi:hypothetical protein